MRLDEVMRNIHLTGSNQDRTANGHATRHRESMDRDRHGATPSTLFALAKAIRDQRQQRIHRFLGTLAIGF